MLTAVIIVTMVYTQSMDVIDLKLMKQRILIVDDSEENRTALIAELEQIFDASFYHAGSGHLASEIIQKLNFSLVISEIEMLDGSGLWLHEFLKNEFPSVPLILYHSVTSTSSLLPDLDFVLKAVLEKGKSKVLCQKIESLGLAAIKTPPLFY